jgi:hypothetical protein
VLSLPAAVPLPPPTNHEPSGRLRSPDTPMMRVLPSLTGPVAAAPDVSCGRVPLLQLHPSPHLTLPLWGEIGRSRPCSALCWPARSPIGPDRAGSATARADSGRGRTPHARGWPTRDPPRARLVKCEPLKGQMGDECVQPPCRTAWNKQKQEEKNMEEGKQRKHRWIPAAL